MQQETVHSHLHSDHIRGLKYLTSSKVLISKKDRKGHQGSLQCRFPLNLQINDVTYTDGKFGAFDSSYKLSVDGNLRIVPTPGHTEGHQSLMLKEDKKYYLFAGDVVFDLRRLNAGKGLAGIVENTGSARDSISRVQSQLSEFNTSMAAAHDHAVGQLTRE